MNNNKNSNKGQSMNETPSADRIHIAFFGVRNAGKSSLVNAFTEQDLSVVSPIKGTTTDPVKKAMELAPLGASMVIDTAGFDDDEPEIGKERLKKTREILDISDIAVLVVDAVQKTENKYEKILKGMFEERKIPFIVAYNKSDLLTEELELSKNSVLVSAKDKTNIIELRERIGQLIRVDENKLKLVGDMIKKGDTILLVMPQGKGSPKGRLILPEQQAIRDILDAECTCISVTEKGIENALENLKTPPDLVITDSQVFGIAARAVSENIPLTSFSMLFARYNGIFETALKGAKTIKNLKSGDKILISEGCTHHRQCDDIGTVKLPAALKKYTGISDLEFEFSSGTGFPDDENKLSEYALCVHCGGCMLRKKAVLNRMYRCEMLSIPFTNYGIALAECGGILDRCAKPLV